MKKMFTLALALIMALSLCVPAMAAGITVNNAIDGHTYDAYKIFDVTYTTDDDGDDTNNAYAYSITTSNEWYENVAAYAADTSKGLTLTAASGAANTYYVSYTKDVFSPEDFAKYLNDNLANKTVKSSGTAVGDIADITVPAAGYYFVNSSMGALCVLNTADDSVVVVEKNSVPTMTKEVQEKDGGAWGASNYADMGEVVEFKMVVTAGAGDPDVDWVITDTMDAGFQVPDNFVVTINDVEIAQGADAWTLEQDDNDFVLTLKKEMIIANLVGQAGEKNDAGENYVTDKIVITYDAVLDSDAVMGGAGNKNTAVLTYGSEGNKDADNVTTTYTYEYSLLKIDGVTGEELAGVKFQLSEGVVNDGETDAVFGTAIGFIETTVGSYRLPVAGDTQETTTTLTTNANGEIIIDGLDGNTTYILREIETLAGYNLLEGDVTVEIATDNNVYNVDAENNIIENNTGSILPSTGGVGTTIFYTVGGVMMAAAVVLFVTKKKLAVQE